jgi:hypothetical protein
MIVVAHGDRSHGGSWKWKSAVGSRKNDDGSISFMTIDPTLAGFKFVVGEKAGKRTLTIRDGQHEYMFTEQG